MCEPWFASLNLTIVILRDGNKERTAKGEHAADINNLQAGVEYVISRSRHLAAMVSVKAQFPVMQKQR